MKNIRKEKVQSEEDMEQEQLQRIQRSNQLKPFPIIGLGGSAGSLDSFERFFLHMPIDSGFAFILVMHIDLVRNIDLIAVIQQYTAMPVFEAIDGMEVLPDSIYMIPPDKDMGIHNGRLLLFKASRLKGAHMSIDYFFQSLAEDQWNLAVAIVLSGIGADGEMGIRMIKEKLGMVMVQQPESAQYPGMPAAAIETSLVDYILTPEEMPVKLVDYLNHPVIKASFSPGQKGEKGAQNHLQKILMLLRSHTGHDFTSYKKNTIIRRIERRIAYHQLPDYTHYINYMRENPHEIGILFKELLIGVTKFFRDRNAFEVLKEQLYGRLHKKGKDEAIRVWIAGCSTGEEAYSIAMLIMEYVDTLALSRPPKVQIFATDLDINAIEHARTGFYFSNIVSEVSQARLERFFVKKNNGYVVKKELREMIVFAQHNLIKDAPFTRLDLLCCRNVMIYFSADLQKRLMPVFHYSLQPGGLMFLGPAESIGVFNEAFQAIDPKWKLFERKEGMASASRMIDFPFNISQEVKHEKESSAKPLARGTTVADGYHKILLGKYTPSSLLVNERGDILYINGKMEKYLQLNSGEAIMNIHKMIREELRYPLGNAIYQAANQKNTVSLTGLKLTNGSKTYLVDFSVEYINDLQLQGLFILTFYDKGVQKKLRSPVKLDESDSQAMSELEKELIYTKHQLSATIEQMETSLEELKSTNEELQSTNEELQSTNEEALTTKEEMQSLNEELMTINLQYHNKAEELTMLNNDMKNLLDNTEIGTIFLDNHLNILRFTPQVTKLFNVIPSDIGRSITHIVSNFDYPLIENDIEEVIDKLTGKQIEVKNRADEWYNLRIMPYRTMNNFISGAVLTFTKITPLKSLENRLSTLLNYVQAVVDTLDEAAIVLDYDRRVLVVNHGFLKLFHFKEFEIKEHFFMEVVHNKWNTDKLDDLLLSNKKGESLFLQHEFPGLGLLSLKINVRYVPKNSATAHTALIVTFKEQEREQKEKRE